MEGKMLEFVNLVGFDGHSEIGVDFGEFRRAEFFD